MSDLCACALIPCTVGRDATAATSAKHAHIHRANAQLTAERDRARDLAVALEAELGRVQALHAGDGKDKHTFAWRVDVTPGGGIALGQRARKWCPECHTEWPCPTTLAISSQA